MNDDLPKVRVEVEVDPNDPNVTVSGGIEPNPLIPVGDAINEALEPVGDVLDPDEDEA